MLMVGSMSWLRRCDCDVPAVVNVSQTHRCSVDRGRVLHGHPLNSASIASTLEESLWQL